MFQQSFRITITSCVDETDSSSKVLQKTSKLNATFEVERNLKVFFHEEKLFKCVDELELEATYDHFTSEENSNFMFIFSDLQFSTLKLSGRTLVTMTNCRSDQEHLFHST